MTNTRPFLSNINLFVSDIERARDFYVRVVGLREDEDRSMPPAFCYLVAGACSITLQTAETPGAMLGKPDSVELGFEVDDLEAVRARLHEAGFGPPAVQHMGWGSGFDVVDPEGFRLSFFEKRG